MFDDIHYFPPHPNQIYILNFGLLKCIIFQEHISIYIPASQNIETAGVNYIVYSMETK
jgi:hypothetical protein